MDSHDLYLSISARAREAAWAWRCVRADGSWSEGAGVQAGANTYRLRLLGLLDALQQAGTPHLTVHTTEAALHEIWDRLPRWAERGWDRDGAPLAHLDLLQQLHQHQPRRTLAWKVDPRRTSSHAKDVKQLARRTAERNPVPELEASARPAAEYAPLTGAPTVLWADGGSRPSGGGWGFVLVHLPTGTTLEGSGAEPEATNNRMELTAVIEGLRSVQRDGALVEVRTDSRLVVQTAAAWLASWKRRGWTKADGEPPANLDLVQQLDAQLQRVRARFTWVRGHAGEPGNEHVDRLATEAIRRLREGMNPRYSRRLTEPPFTLPVGTPPD